MPKQRKNPVLQRYQVQIKGNLYYVINTANGMTVAGPYESRIAAQDRADQLERTNPRR